MILPNHPLALLAGCAFFSLTLAAKWPNHVINELEHLLVDTDGFNDAGLQKAITPCTNYVSGSQLLGRETAAQWVRVAFRRSLLISHSSNAANGSPPDDFATADVESGTGGIDASIGFETLRPENSGSAMNDSLGFFAPFVNAHVSSKRAHGKARLTA
jgi:hypothetical protein